MKTYDFSKKADQYDKFRPSWPDSIARHTLAMAGIFYSRSQRKWLGIGENQTCPVIVSVGSGTGLDAEPFLKIGCIVYGIEPSEEMRKKAEDRLKKYPGQFISIAGTSSDTHLPDNVKADIIVCAQSLHTFSSKHTDLQGNEEATRKHWQKIIVDDEKPRIAIWSYNPLKASPMIQDLHQILTNYLPSYKNSDTGFIDGVRFDPKYFQYYIESSTMTCPNTPIKIGEVRIRNLEELKEWITSYSFAPKTENELQAVMTPLTNWYNKYKSTDGVLTIRHYATTHNGQLLRQPLEVQNDHDLMPVSPTSIPLQQASVASDNWRSLL